MFGCAVALAAGAYLILSRSASEGPAVRQEVTAASGRNATAPAWVNTGQSPTPDYSAIDAAARNATPVEESAPKMPREAIEIREDGTVTLAFVEALTDSLLAGFQPVGSRGAPATTITIKSLNLRFGQELTGFSVSGDDPGASRRAVLDYVFTPGTIRMLHELYAPVLLTHLVDSATLDERSYTVGDAVEERTLTKAETAIMLRLVAQRAEQTASALRAINTDQAITELASKYLGAAKAVERANLQLQQAIDANRDSAETGQRLKQAILQREQIRESIITRMRDACPGCPDSDLFYLAQWSYRRVRTEPDKRLAAFAEAADALDDLAKRMRDRSAQLE
jgi:hypothetical protein